MSTAKVIKLRSRLSKKEKKEIRGLKWLEHFREKMALDFEQSALKFNKANG